MAAEGLKALVLAPGTSLTYFTGRAVGRERALLRGRPAPGEGEPAWVTPAFEIARARSRSGSARDVRAWEEDESPFALVAAILKDRGAAAGDVGIEETMPFTFANEIGAAAPAARLRTGTPVTAGCRMIKDAHEIALMRRACEITVRAHRAVLRLAARGHDAVRRVRALVGSASPAGHARRLAGALRPRRRVPARHDAAAAAAARRRRAHRRRRPAARLRQRHHAHRRLRRRRRPSGSARSGTPCGGPSRPPSRPRVRAWRRRRWTPPRAASSRTRASAPATAPSPTASATASAWTATSGRTS